MKSQNGKKSLQGQRYMAYINYVPLREPEGGFVINSVEGGKRRMWNTTRTSAFKPQ